MDISSERDQLLRTSPQISNAFLAGGAITSVFTNNPINDYDLYFKSEKDFVEAVYTAFENGWFCLSVTNRSVTFSDSGQIVQFMHFRFFQTPEEIFDSFDFTCCMGALDLTTKELHLHPRFLVDNSKKEMIFNPKTNYPIASGMRTKKYAEKGYSISKAELMKVLTTVAMLPVNSWEDLADQFGGFYGEVFGKVDTSLPFVKESVQKVVDSLCNTYVPLAVDKDFFSPRKVLSYIYPDKANTFEDGVFDSLLNLR